MTGLSRMNVVGRIQSLASGLAGVSGALLLLVGLVTSYMRISVLSTPGFTARMEAVRRDRATRELLAGVIVRQIEARGRPDLVAARPLLEQAVASAIGSDAFEPIYRAAVENLHRELLTPGGTSLLLNLSDLGVLVIDALEAKAPALAAQIPINLRSGFVEIGPHGSTHLFMITENLRPV